MSETRWWLLVVLALLGYAQRSLPWIFSERMGLGPAVTRWLTYVAPAAFATLLVYDLGRVDVSTLIALIGAGLVAGRTKNLGGAVFAAMGIKLIFVWLVHGLGA